MTTMRLWPQNGCPAGGWGIRQAIFAAAWLVTLAGAGAACNAVLQIEPGTLLPDGSGGAGGQGGSAGSVGGSGGGGGGATGGGGSGGGVATPDGPRIFFTDLTAVPATGGSNDDGGYVRVYGLRIAGAGTTTVRIGGVEAVVHSALAGAGARGLDVVTFQPGAAVTPAANQELIISYDGAVSNALQLTVNADRDIYTVDPMMGDDSNDGISAPFATTGRLVAALQPGDVGYLRGGTYAANYDCSDDSSGIDCALPLVDLNSGGSTQNPIAIAGWPGEIANLGYAPADVSNFLSKLGFRVEDDNITLSNLTFIDTGTSGIALGSENLRLVGNHFTEFYGHGLMMNGGANEIFVYGNLFDNPTGFASGIQPNAQTAGDAGYNEFDGAATPMSFEMGELIDFHFHDNFILSGFYNVEIRGCPGGCSSTTWVYNNIFIGGWYALGLPTQSTDQGIAHVFNNTFDGATGCAIKREHPDNVPLPDPDGEGIFFDNNIVSVGLGGDYFCYHDGNNGGMLTANTDVRLRGANNLWNGNTQPIGSLGMMGEPDYVDPPLDFSLGMNSAATDAGSATVGNMQSLPPELVLDHNGYPRITGSAIDLGAHERL